MNTQSLKSRSTGAAFCSILAIIAIAIIYIPQRSMAHYPESSAIENYYIQIQSNPIPNVFDGFLSIHSNNTAIIGYYKNGQEIHFHTTYETKVNGLTYFYLTLNSGRKFPVMIVTLSSSSFYGFGITSKGFNFVIGLNFVGFPL